MINNRNEKKTWHRVFVAPLKAASTNFLNVLFPNDCPGCKRPLADNKLPLCARCAFILERADPATIRNSLDKHSGASEAFELMLSLWMFDKSGVLQGIHQELKYRNRPYTGLALGRLMGSALLLPLHPANIPDLIVPIPLHRRRLFERGYNQSDLLAQGIAEAIHQKPTTDVLLRTLHTHSQTSLAKEERLQNVANAFAIQNSSKVENKHVLLVDDVITTGATLLAASIPLRNAGALKISFATLGLARI